VGPKRAEAGELGPLRQAAPSKNKFCISTLILNFSGCRHYGESKIASFRSKFPAKTNFPKRVVKTTCYSFHNLSIQRRSFLQSGKLAALLATEIFSSTKIQIFPPKFHRASHLGACLGAPTALLAQDPTKIHLFY
jgi:hypothetical protein